MESCRAVLGPFLYCNLILTPNQPSVPQAGRELGRMVAEMSQLYEDLPLPLPLHLYPYL